MSSGLLSFCLLLDQSAPLKGKPVLDLNQGQDIIATCIRMMHLKGRLEVLLTFWRNHESPAFASPAIDGLCYVDELLLVVHGPVDLRSKLLSSVHHSKTSMFDWFNETKPHGPSATNSKAGGLQSNTMISALKSSRCCSRNYKKADGFPRLH